MTEENPLLKKIKLPGKRVRLPSRGLFYTNGELAEDVTDGEIEVFSMTASDEIALRTPEFLYSGEAIRRVFNRCIPEVNKPLELLSNDVDYLLTCIRIVSYGDMLPLDVRCSECSAKQDIENDEAMNEFMLEIEAKAEEQNIAIEVALQSEKVQRKRKIIRGKQAPLHTININLSGILANNTTEIVDLAPYEVTLSNEQTLSLTPVNFESSVMIYKFQGEDFTKDLTQVEDYIAFLLGSRIKSIDGTFDPEQIREWVKQLPVSLKTELNDQSAKIPDWGTDFTYNIECPDCGHERNVDALLNPINFFTVPSKSAE